MPQPHSPVVPESYPCDSKFDVSSSSAFGSIVASLTNKVVSGFPTWQRAPLPPTLTCPSKLTAGGLMSPPWGPLVDSGVGCGMGHSLYPGKCLASVPPHLAAPGPAKTQPWHGVPSRDSPGHYGNGPSWTLFSSAGFWALHKHRTVKADSTEAYCGNFGSITAP